jgi:hypothetical protein
MIDILALLLRIAGSGLILLSVLHIPIGKRLQWAEDCKRLTPVNESVFHVHTFFICLVLVMMGLPCLIDPSIFLTPSPAGAWIAWSFAAFWAIRLYFQWFVYKADLWRGKPMETAVHWWFTLIWISLSGVFAACGAVQAGWLQ